MALLLLLLPSMIYSPLFLSLATLVLIVLYVPPTSGEPIYQFCSNTGYYIPNSTYQSNLDALLPSLISNGSLSGFSTAAVGRTPDQVYGLILCRGDTNATLCRSCLDTAGQDILQLCPYDVDATIWYDRCLLRYSNQQFISSYNNSPRFNLAMNQNVTDPGRYDKLVGELLDRVSRWAAYNSSRRFATGEVYYSAEFPKIYGLAQCTVDLSGDQCSRCFQGFTDVNRTRFNGAVEGFGLGVRCNFRYGLFLFYDGASTLVLSSPPPESPPLDSLQSGEKDSGNEKNVTDIILAISIPLVTALVVIVIVCICFWRRRPTIKPPYETKLEEIRRVKFKVFDLSTLVAATSNFSDVNKLGEGGFAAVYKGTLPNEGEIAVKRLSSSSVQGLGELKNELILVAKLQHRNLVSLLGVCLEEHEKLLVYEYVPNRSLDKFLFDPIKCRELNWARRYKIIGGIVRGLLYLHEDSQLKIIHRDLKASNILLDADMNPKISDFGLARLFGGDQTQGSTSRAVGTFGYMSPEYAMRGQISIKLDVFSFGVLVLEILTGRKHSGSFASENAKDLLSSTWEHWTRGTISEILDPTLDENCPKSEVLRCIRIGLLCVQDDPADRPSMSKVVVMLNSHSVSLQSPSRPTFNIRKSGMESDIFYKATHFQGGTGDQSSSKLISMTPNEVSISEIEPR